MGSPFPPFLPLPLPSVLLPCLSFSYCVLLAAQRRDPLTAAYARELLSPGLCKDFFVQLLEQRKDDR